MDDFNYRMGFFILCVIIIVLIYIIIRVAINLWGDKDEFDGLF